MNRALSCPERPMMRIISRKFPSAVFTRSDEGYLKRSARTRCARPNVIVYDLC